MRRCRHILPMALLELLEQLARVGEAEIMQHHDDFLQIGGSRRLVVDDQRRCFYALQLEPVMRMHPIGAGLLEGKMVIFCVTRMKRRRRKMRHAILAERVLDAVPMHQGLLGQMVFELGVKRGFHIRIKPVRPVWLDDAKNRGGLAVHFDRPAFHPEVDALAGNRRIPQKRRLGIGESA